MPLNLQNIRLPKSRAYRTGSEYEPYEFFLAGLVNSNQFDFLLGYFSSSAINILALGFAKFISNGGNVRFIINQFLSTSDKEAILEGQRLQQEDLVDKQIDLNNLANDLSDRGKHFFKCLAYLIAKNRIEIVCITPKMGTGISHFKSGIFSDGTNQLYFKGSCNFTASGLISNLEELEVKESWDTAKDRAAIKEYCKYFEDLFDKKADFVNYLQIEETTKTISEYYGEIDLDELLVDEEYLISKYLTKGDYGKRTKSILHELKDEIANYQNSPKFPFTEGPRAYQSEAYKNWCNNDYQGIFAMATGTGKTITSLNCLLQEIKKGKEHIYHAIILVPTITLVNQWTEEALKFNFQEIIKVSSKFKWEKELATTLSTSKRLPISFIIISTYASFVKDRFNKYIKDLPLDTIFIADEAHNLGSPSVLKKLPSILLKKRIGLSATPKRIYDPEGSSGMEGFFNDREPYTYSFSMERAIEEGILCKYYYHPHIVNLTAEELIEYIEITKKIAKFFNNKTGALDDNEIVQKLLLKRKRIIHKAVNKLEMTRQILQNRFDKEGHLKYTFIYVPEGSTPEISEDEKEDDETIKIINQYTREIGRIDDSVRVNQFISGMADRNEVLDQFKEGKIHVIASMKCLDEGVDIPRAEYAIFCSSTGNPRQFIQRRGRILRKHPQESITSYILM
jgi:superfamily II DNA or RNA helicase